MEGVRRGFGLPGCLEFHQVLGRMMLTVPQDVRRARKAARPKKSGMRYEHAAAGLALTSRRRGALAGMMVVGGAGVAIAGLCHWAIFRPKALLIAENLCLRQQLVVLQRRHPRPRLSDADRRFWILASRWFNDWGNPLRIVKPETVLGWQRASWRAYWRWRSSRQARGGRPAIRGEFQARLWGQKRIQAELARLGFRGPTGTWRDFLTRHASDIWACDFFCAPTVLSQTLNVFFVIRLANRQILHVEVTRHPTAGSQQIVECCAWDRAPPRFFIHDRDSRYGASFDRRLRGLGIRPGAPSLRDGCDLRDLSVWTISLSSAKPICVEFYRRTSPITIVDDHTARWAKQLPAARRCLSGSKLVERSPRHLCSAGDTIFTGLLQDTFLRPTAGSTHSSSPLSRRSGTIRGAPSIMTMSGALADG
jgi:hypothetical protein